MESSGHNPHSAAGGMGIGAQTPPKNKHNISYTYTEINKNKNAIHMNIQESENIDDRNAGTNFCQTSEKFASHNGSHNGNNDDRMFEKHSTLHGAQLCADDTSCEKEKQKDAHAIHSHVTRNIVTRQPDRNEGKVF